MSVTITKDDKPVSVSRNLRGVMTYARKHGVSDVSFRMTDSYEAAITISFQDGAHCSTHFAAWDVCQRWVRARRSWDIHAVSIRPTSEYWTATAPFRNAQH